MSLISLLMLSGTILLGPGSFITSKTVAESAAITARPILRLEGSTTLLVATTGMFNQR
jgi:hypothetical protein